MTIHELQRAAGPGLIFAGSAIGVSHLVQSTRAGAIFGLALVGVIVLINALKYPAFRFGVDYAHSTGKTLIGGYRELSPWLVVLQGIVSLLIMPIGGAAVTATTAAILAAVTGTDLPLVVLVLLILGATLFVLLVGGYRWLEKLSAALVLFLTLATILAAALALPRVQWASAVSVDWAFDPMALLFVIALAGFMPTAISQSVDVSLWTLQSQKSDAPGERVSLQTARKGFLGAYLLTGFLAICFCIMGAGIMHADGLAPESGAAQLAAQIIALYAQTLGPGAAFFVGIAALCVMATTVAAAFDGAARGLGAIYQEYRGDVGGTASRTTYAFFLILMAILSTAFLALFLESFTDFIDLVTSIFFVLTPTTALLNHLVVTRCDMDEEDRPSARMKALSLCGIVVMSAMTVVFFVLKANA
ncbi:MAG: divalent metal cation transporter [Pseudomonadota bacterium]